MEWTPKPPEDTRLYSYDLAEIAPDTISTATFTRASGTVTLTAVDPTDTVARVLVAGGANGETASLVLTAVTTAGQIIERTVTLEIATGADELNPVSSLSKGAIVVRALSKIGIANYVFDTEAEEDVAALNELDTIASEAQALLSPFPYNQPATEGGSLPTDDSGIAQGDVSFFIYNLAEQIAESYGKTPGPRTTRRAAETRSSFYARYARIPEYQLTRKTPVGGGNRLLGRNFFCG